MTYRSQARQLETKKTYLEMVSKMKSEAAAGSKIIFALSQNPPKTWFFEILNSMAANRVPVGGGRFASCLLPSRSSAEFDTRGHGNEREDLHD